MFLCTFWQVYNVLCSVFRKAQSLKCKTPAVSSPSDSNSVVATIDVGYAPVIVDTFSYRPNPVLNKISPLRTITR